jgi:hypothetical protein
MSLIETNNSKDILKRESPWGSHSKNNKPGLRPLYLADDGELSIRSSIHSKKVALNCDQAIRPS